MSLPVAALDAFNASGRGTVSFPEGDTAAWPSGLLSPLKSSVHTRLYGTPPDSDCEVGGRVVPVNVAKFSFGQMPSSPIVRPPSVRKIGGTPPQSICGLMAPWRNEREKVCCEAASKKIPSFTTTQHLTTRRVHPGESGSICPCRICLLGNCPGEKI